MPAAGAKEGSTQSVGTRFPTETVRTREWCRELLESLSEPRGTSQAQLRKAHHAERSWLRCATVRFAGIHGRNPRNQSRLQPGFHARQSREGWLFPSRAGEQGRPGDRPQQRSGEWPRRGQLENPIPSRDNARFVPFTEIIFRKEVWIPCRKSKSSSPTAAGWIHP